MKIPRVSIVVKHHGGIDALEESINSLLRQTLEEWELLCIHHTSEEPYNGKAAADIRVRSIRAAYRDHSGCAHVGLQAAHAPYVLFLEEGDTLAPQALEEMYRAMEHSSHHALIPFSPGEDIPAPWGRLYRRESICHKRWHVSLDGYRAPTQWACEAETLPDSLYFHREKGSNTTRRLNESEHIFAAYLHEVFNTLCRRAV